MSEVIGMGRGAGLEIEVWILRFVADGELGIEK